MGRKQPCVGLCIRYCDVLGPSESKDLVSFCQKNSLAARCQGAQVPVCQELVWVPCPSRAPCSSHRPWLRQVMFRGPGQAAE